MAAPNALLFSSKGGVSTKFVAGSRRKSPTKKSKKSCVRAGFFSQDDEKNTTEEEQSSSSSSSSLAGKAVSAVVAAAISLSSAGQAAVASSSQVQLVRLSSHNRCIFLFLKHQKERSDRFLSVLDMMMDLISSVISKLTQTPFFLSPF